MNININKKVAGSSADELYEQKQTMSQETLI